MQPTPELATFFGLQFLSNSAAFSERGHRCGAARCAVLHWLLQVQDLATAVGQQTGQPTSVHMLATCLRPSVGALLSRRGGAPVRVLSPAAELARAAAGLRRHWHWQSPKFLTLLKWQAVRLVSARLVVLLDLDVEVLPYRLGRGAAYVASVAEDWAGVLACALRSNASLLGWPDHDAPFNAAMAVLRPSLRLYDDGVALLRRGRFNRSHGWDYVGRPSRSVPPEDDAWRVGLFFHIFHIAHPGLGRDLRLTPCARRGGGAARLHHYVAGCKPQQCVRQLGCHAPRTSHAPIRHPRQPPGPVRAMFGGGAASSPPKAIHAAFVARALSWAQRGATDLARLAAALNASSSFAAAASSTTAAAAAASSTAAAAATDSHGSGLGRGCGGGAAEACADVASCAARLGRTAACVASGLHAWEATGQAVAALRRGSRRWRGGGGAAAEEERVSAAAWVERLLGPEAPERGMPEQALAEAAATTGYQADHLPYGREECERRRRQRPKLPPGQCASGRGGSAHAAWAVWRASQ